MKKVLLIVLIISCCTWLTQANSQQQPDHGLNKIMSRIGTIMVELFPLIFEEKSSTHLQIKKINLLTQQLQIQFKNARPYIRRKSPTYQMSYQLLSDYLEAIVTEDNPASISHIKQRLTTLSDFCISCHTQDNKFRTLFKGKDTLPFKSSLAHAEFNYATRNYIKAHEYYEKYLALNTNLRDSEVLRVIFKLLSIYTQIIPDPKTVIKVLSDLEDNSTLSKPVKNYIRESKLAVKHLNEAMLANTQPSFKELQDYVNLYLGGINAKQGIIFTTPQEEVERLWLRGLLFRYLNRQATQNQMPYILYWLALCDRSLGHGYDYTLADFYIKQCITRYSFHPVARICFNEHKEYLKFYYTSPSEPVLPFEVNQELEKLEAYLK